MASRPPPAPKPPTDIDTNQQARDQYWRSMEQYYKDQGVEDYRNRAKGDVNAAREAQRTNAAAQQVSSTDRNRVNNLYRQVLGRSADNSGLVTYAGMSDADIRKSLQSSLEYNQRKGNITVLANRDKNYGQGAQIVFNNTAGGRALMENQEWIRANIKTGDTIITPKGYGDLKYGSGYDELRRSEDKTALTAKDIQENAWLSKAGYKAGDFIAYESKVKKPKSGLFNWVDDALGTNTARFWDKHVSDQVKGILHVATLGTTTGFITRENAGVATKGAAKAFGASEKSVARTMGYANVVVDVLLNTVGNIVAPGLGSAVSAAKNAALAANQYQAGNLKMSDLLTTIGTEAALAFVGANAAKAAAAAKAAKTAAQVGQAASGLSRIGSAIGSAATSLTSGGTMAAKTAINFAANKARGLDDSKALTEAAWGALGSGTAGISTVLRYGTSKSAQASLKDPATGKIDPLRAAQVVGSAAQQGFTAATSEGGILGNFKSTFAPSSWNPVAGVARLAGAANDMYGTIAGVTYSRLEATPAYTPSVEAAGAEYGGRLFASEQPADRQYSGTEANSMLTNQSFAPAPTSGRLTEYATPGSTIRQGSQNYGQSITYAINEGTPGEYTMTARQNYLPSIGGVRNFAATVGNIAIFGRANPTFSRNGQEYMFGFRQGPGAGARRESELNRMGWRP